MPTKIPKIINLRQFFKDRKRKKNVGSLALINNYKKDTYKHQIKGKFKSELSLIDEQIKITTRNIFQAQNVTIRSYLSRPKGPFGSFQINRQYQKAQYSAKWHLNDLKNLLEKRRIVQNQYDKVKGIYWTKKILYGLIFILTGAFLLISTMIIGSLLIIYILPLTLIIITAIGLKYKFNNNK